MKASHIIQIILFQLIFTINIAFGYGHFKGTKQTGIQNQSSIENIEKGFQYDKTFNSFKLSFDNDSLNHQINFIRNFTLRNHLICQNKLLANSIDVRMKVQSQLKVDGNLIPDYIHLCHTNYK